MRFAKNAYHLAQTLIVYTSAPTLSMRKHVNLIRGKQGGERVKAGQRGPPPPLLPLGILVYFLFYLPTPFALHVTFLSRMTTIKDIRQKGEHKHKRNVSTRFQGMTSSC